MCVTYLGDSLKFIAGDDFPANYLLFILNKTIQSNQKIQKNT